MRQNANTNVSLILASEGILSQQVTEKIIILETICNKPSSPIIVNSDRITVSFNTGSSFAAGKRGAGFSLDYTTNDAGIPTFTHEKTIYVCTCKF